MAEHYLKTWTNAWDAVASGAKRFEYRCDDRGFEVGDVLVLRKWDPHGNYGGCFVMRSIPGRQMAEYTELRARVTYILRGLHGVPPGFCVMSIETEPPK